MHHFLTAGTLSAMMYGVPERIDRLVAEGKLQAEGIRIDAEREDKSLP
jgi:S-adenosylhomocysteine hydrolase